MANKKQHKGTKPYGFNITQVIFSALIGVVGFMGVQMQTDIKSLEKTLSDFVKVPRFTKADYDTNTAPILKQLNYNTKEISDRSTFMEETNTSLLKLDLRILQLEKNANYEN